MSFSLPPPPTLPPPTLPPPTLPPLPPPAHLYDLKIPTEPLTF